MMVPIVSVAPCSTAAKPRGAPSPAPLICDVLTLLPGDGPGRKRIGAAGIDQEDGERHLGAEFIEDAGQRHEILLDIFERRQIGIDRHQPVLATRFDAMTGVIDDRRIRPLGILGEAFEIAAQFLGVAVGRAGDVEPQVLEQALDGAGVVLRDWSGREGVDTSTGR